MARQVNRCASEPPLTQDMESHPLPRPPEPCPSAPRPALDFGVPELSLSLDGCHSACRGCLGLALGNGTFDLGGGQFVAKIIPLGLRGIRSCPLMVELVAE